MSTHLTQRLQTRRRDGRSGGPFALTPHPGSHPVGSPLAAYAVATHFHRRDTLSRRNISASSVVRPRRLCPSVPSTLVFIIFSTLSRWSSVTPPRRSVAAAIPRRATRSYQRAAIIAVAILSTSQHSDLLFSVSAILPHSVLLPPVKKVRPNKSSAVECANENRFPQIYKFLIPNNLLL